MDRPRRVSGQALWRSMSETLCPGSKVFIACVAITTFIVMV